MKYDVVIVGSGPAGSVTARFAAEAGAKVLILERRTEVGVPVLCGEGISQRVDKWDMLEGKRWIASKMDGAKIYAPDGTLVTLSKEIAGNETGYVVYRDIFDQELARRAAKAGAKIMMRAEVTGLKKEGEKITGIKVRQFGEEFDIDSDVVVGADGVESKVGQWAGINTVLKPNDLETCAQYTLTNVDHKSNYCEFFIGKKIAPGGYVWIFPKGKDTFNVGIGILASLCEPGMPLKLLDRFIAGQPELITGGGLTTSLEGGKIAGETIGKAVDEQKFDKETLSIYETGWKQAFAKKLLRNYVVKDIMLDFEDKTLNMLADSLKDYKFEEFSTLSLVKALVLKHPTLLMKLKPLLRLSEKSIKKE